MQQDLHLLDVFMMLYDVEGSCTTVYDQRNTSLHRDVETKIETQPSHWCLVILLFLTRVYLF